MNEISILMHLLSKKSEEFKNIVGPYMTEFPHYPGVYEAIRT